MKEIGTKLRQMVYIAELLSNERLTLDEIRDRWKDAYASDGKVLTDRRWSAIRDSLLTVFGIHIEYNPRITLTITKA